MRPKGTIVTALLVLLLMAGTASGGQVDSFQTEGEPLRITPITHGSLRIEYGELTIQVDPWRRGDYAGMAAADLILVTDIHPDHLDPQMIARLRDEETVVVVPAAAAESVEGGRVLGNGERTEVAGVAIEAVPMYNLARGPEEGQLFHDKGRGNGYLVSVGGKRLYIAGDTACTPEMKSLEGIDVAFVPMNLPYTMPPGEAAECVRAFRPAVVYPYHYRGSDLTEFTSALADLPEVEVRLREWYPSW